MSRAHFDFFDLFFNLFELERISIIGFPGVWTDSPVWHVRSEETLSWGISRLRYCDPRVVRKMKNSYEIMH